MVLNFQTNIICFNLVLNSPLIGFNMAIFLVAFKVVPWNIISQSAGNADHICVRGLQTFVRQGKHLLVLKNISCISLIHLKMKQGIL